MKVTIGQGVLNVLEELKENLSTLEHDTREYARQIFYSKEIQEFIVERNTDLLFEGRRPDLTQIEKTPEGNQKSSFYERQSIYERKQLGLDVDFVNLKRTGFFYKSIKVRSGSEELLEFSDDPKAAELERIWGNILGISEQDLFDLRYKIIPKIITFVNNKLKSKL